MADIQETVDAWGSYLEDVTDWEALVNGVQPKVVGCGSVYELSNPINRPGESFAIADMRELDLAEPHKHVNGETEIYFVLRGVGKISVGSEISSLYRGVSIVTPPDTVHITKPGKGLVLAVVNTPPFNPDNYVVVDPREQAVIDAVEKLNT